jgi:hypothetical protein
MRWSDNAAADYVLARVGKQAVDQFIRRHGLVRQEPIAPVFGELLAWSTTPPGVWRAFPARTRARRAWETAAATTGAASARTVRLPPAAAQRELADASFGGTPREWARLLVNLCFGARDDPSARTVRRHLAWPHAAYPDATTRFALLGGKAGAIAGVRTEALCVEPRGRTALAAALFLRHVDPEDEERLARSFADQAFLVRLAEDPRFLARVRTTLATSD